MHPRKLQAARKAAKQGKHEQPQAIHAYRFEPLRLSTKIKPQTNWESYFGGQYRTRTCDLSNVNAAL
jgi:hypothetical protein